ncbi:DUF1014-domain-containing protein [Daldinia caldariorum]|uniref:DUF1014-domain-containing protein n=1 Tax=Daldinia caldariorum TaxID=326644 RepID=UPI0020086E3E|nr:DUF1014-domain-containing protein [Daldinia caldariorum]KAI1470719.1 DUF1014-domain-containing protein [Daldinia caldariorum]
MIQEEKEKQITYQLLAFFGRIYTQFSAMAGKKGSDNSKKAAGQARKAQTAANKAAAEDAKKAAEEDAEWAKGAKNNSKKEAQEAKRAEQARKKAEKEALAAEEEKSLPSRAGPKNSKTAVKKTNRGIDGALSNLSIDDDKNTEYQASGTDAILDLLEGLLLSSSEVKVDKHVSRRVKAAYAKFEERRLKEMKEDGSIKELRFTQRKEQLAKEFMKSPENPYNSSVNVGHNATKEEIKETQEQELARKKAQFASKTSE